MIKIDDMIAEVKAELAIRKHVYRKKVDAAKPAEKTKVNAALQQKFRRMREVLRTLLELKKLQENTKAYQIIDKDDEEVFEIVFANDNLSTLYLQMAPQLKELPYWSVVAQIFPMYTDDGRHVIRGMFADDFITAGIHDNIKRLREGISDSEAPF